MATAPQRTHLAALMQLLLANEPRIHYQQRRPMLTRAIYEQQAVDLFAAGGSVSSDCSETVTWLCKMAGLQDPNGLAYNGQGFCHEPSARILTSDLRWIAAGDVKVGEELWAFDTNLNIGVRRGRARRYRRAKVLASFLSAKECVRVVLDDSETLICSTDHPWLSVAGVGESYRWTKARDLLASPHLVRPFLPWKQDETYEAGWLAGMLDGEGWVSKGKTASGEVGATQVVGPTADKLVAVASRYSSLRVSRIERPGVQPRLDITTNGGGMYAAAELLGRVRPERLISAFSMETGTVMRRHSAKVVAVEPIGLREVQSIQTTAGTYFAEGFAVHNTGTLLSNLPHYTDPADANVGALVVWSDPRHPQGNHVAMVLTPGRDPWLFSHGSENGPKRVRLSAETAAQERMHAGTSTILLSVARL